VRVPSAEQEDARRASRERDRLVKEQTAHTTRIKALLRLLEWRSEPAPARLAELAFGAAGLAKARRVPPRIQGPSSSVSTRG